MQNMMSSLVVVLVLIAVILQSGSGRATETSEFLLLAQDYGISYIQLPSNTISALSLNNFTFAHSVEYDVRHNCVFWADFTRIVRQCFADNSVQVLISTGVDRIEGLAYDWLSETMYYHDSGCGKIVAVDVSPRAMLQPHRQWRRTIVNYHSPIVVNAIAVHPEYGYLFWSQYRNNGSDNGPEDSAIHRIEFDGTGNVVPSHRTNARVSAGISIDFGSDRLYWIDSVAKAVLSCDLDGGTSRVETNLSWDSSQTNLSLSVYNGVVYWTDSEMKIHVWNTSSAEKHEIRLINSSAPIRDLKVYEKSSRMGTNACSDSTHNCTHICVSGLNGLFSCLCPDALNSTDDGTCVCLLDHEDECHEHFESAYCEGRILCKDDHYSCIPESYVCGKRFILIIRWP